MRTAAMAEMIKLAEGDTTPFNSLVRESIEDGMVIGSVLKEKLGAAGYSVETKPGEKHGFFVDIKKDGNLVGFAFAHSESEAVKQAVLAEMRQAGSVTIEITEDVATS